MSRARSLHGAGTACGYRVDSSACVRLCWRVWVSQREDSSPRVVFRLRLSPQYGGVGKIIERGMRCAASNVGGQSHHVGGGGGAPSHHLGRDPARVLTCHWKRRQHLAHGARVGGLEQQVKAKIQDKEGACTPHPHSPFSTPAPSSCSTPPDPHTPLYRAYAEHTTDCACRQTLPATLLLGFRHSGSTTLCIGEHGVCT